LAALAVIAFPLVLAQRRETQSSSTFSLEAKDGEKTVQIANVAYELVGEGIPGLPRNQRLVLRKTTRTKQVVDEIGMEASATVEAWLLGADFRQKPLYSLTVAGTDPAVNGDVLVVSRGLEETAWWSVYKLGNGQHLFDTYVPVAPFSISREVLTLRLAGLEVATDDATDARLKDPHAIAVLTYASAERVIREALITSDDPNQAVRLRSLADATRTLTLVERPSRGLTLSISQNYPSAPQTVTMTIPIVRDDLDLAHAQAPPRLHVAAWKR
jgi:hypothetical protein